MPSTNIAATSLTRNVSNGVNLAAALTAVDAVEGNNFANDGHTLLRVKNTDASSKTVTVKFVNQKVDGVTLADPIGKTYTIPSNTGDRLIGPFPVNLYGSTVEVEFSNSTGTTAAVYQPAN